MENTQQSPAPTPLDFNTKVTSVVSSPIRTGEPVVAVPAITKRVVKVDEPTLGPAPENPGNGPGVETPQGSESVPEGNVGEATKDLVPADRLDRLNRVERREQERSARAHAARKEAETAKAELEKVRQTYSRFDGLDELVATDAVAAIEKATGMSFNDIVDQVIKTGNAKKEPKADDKVAELEKRLNDKEEAEAKQRQESERVTRLENERVAAVSYLERAHKHMEANADDFELTRIRGNQAFDDAWQLAEASFKQTGKVPDPVQVMATLEKHYEDEAMELLSKSKRLQGKVAPAPTTQAPAKKQPTPTLGGKMSQVVPGKPLGYDKDGKRLSDDERERQIVAWARAQKR